MIRVVGIAPSRSSDPKRPFSGRTGRALCRLAAVEDYADLVGRAELRNLEESFYGSGLPPAARLRERAERERRTWSAGERVLLVGATVARAFGLGSIMPYQWVEDVASGALVSWIPHPSGRNRQYNDPRVRRLAADHLRDLFAKREET